MRGLILSKSGCTYCVKAAELFKERGIEYTEEKDTPKDKLPGKTYPQIFIDGNHIV